MITKLPTEFQINPDWHFVNPNAILKPYNIKNWNHKSGRTVIKVPSELTSC